MARLFGRGVLLALGVSAGVCPVLGPTAARSQTYERDVTITGPRGRSVERQTEIHRGPGGIDRDLTIRRPGGTYERQTHIGRAPGFGGGGYGRGGFGPAPGRNVFVERDVFINRGGPGLSGLADFGIGAAVGTGAGLLLGRAFAPPPPPVYVVPEPLYVAPPVFVPPPPPPVVVYNPPVRYQPAPPPATIVVDPVAQAAARLGSPSHHSRRDSALILGRLGDARGVPPLVDRLKHDASPDVRVAAASALGAIGDPRSAIILERAIIYDKKQKVRDAASAALARMPRETVTVPSGAPVTSSAPAPSISLEPAEGASVPSLDPIERVPPPPTPSDGRR